MGELWIGLWAPEAILARGVVASSSTGLGLAPPSRPDATDLLQQLAGPVSDLPCLDPNDATSFGDTHDSRSLRIVL
jgi:hypothetical protein